MSGNDPDQTGEAWDPAEFERKLAELEATLDELPPPDPNRRPNPGGGLLAQFLAAYPTKH